ncbi:hypothetical protein JXB11_01005 [Candidatus Woesearchaeota archaeon]|nr:hypothetical protein [Candidatus Woesearchaeota archaeon]
MAKAQSDVFKYIFAVLLIALIFIFGYRALFGVGEQVEISRYSEFKAELSSDITSAALHFGSAKLASYSVPSFVSEVCFYGPSEDESALDDSCSPLPEYPLVQDSVSDSSGKNVFLLGELPEAVFMPYVNTGICPLRCFKVNNGKLSLFMNGMGNTTIISAEGS